MGLARGVDALLMLGAGLAKLAVGLEVAGRDRRVRATRGEVNCGGSNEGGTHWRGDHAVRVPDPNLDDLNGLVTRCRAFDAKPIDQRVYPYLCRFAPTLGRGRPVQILRHSGPRACSPRGAAGSRGNRRGRSVDGCAALCCAAMRSWIGSTSAIGALMALALGLSGGCKG